MTNIELKNKNRKLKAGFTLIELLVATTLFIIVMVVSLASVLSIVDVNRKAQALNSVMTNLDFALESMVRDIREGSGYCATGSFNNGSGCSAATNASSISFFNSQGQPTTYSFSQVQVNGVTVGEIQKSVNNGAPSVITAPEVNITSMLFSIRGNAVSDNMQPIVILTIQGKTGVNLKTQSTFQVETLITQRLLDS